MNGKKEEIPLSEMKAGALREIFEVYEKQTLFLAQIVLHCRGSGGKLPQEILIECLGNAISGSSTNKCEGKCGIELFISPISTVFGNLK